MSTLSELIRDIRKAIKTGVGRCCMVDENILRLLAALEKRTAALEAIEAGRFLDADRIARAALQDTETQSSNNQPLKEGK